MIQHFNLFLENGLQIHPMLGHFIAVMGCIGAFAFYFVLNAYSIASPSVVSLYEYSLIIWSILTGIYFV